MVFSFDDVIVSTHELQRRAWAALAAEEGLPWPTIERPQIYTIRPERAIMDVLMWTRDFKRARDLAYGLALHYSREFQLVQQPLPGVQDWLEVLHKFKIPCAVVSSLDRVVLGDTLERLGIRRHFAAMTSMEDGFETQSQLLLAACWSLNRAPNQCVVVAASPTGKWPSDRPSGLCPALQHPASSAAPSDHVLYLGPVAGIQAAHNCSCKAVGVQGKMKGFELKAADIKARGGRQSPRPHPRPSPANRNPGCRPCHPGCPADRAERVQHQAPVFAAGQ